MECARPGTVWLRTAVEVEADPALALFHSRRNLRELAVINLATDQTTSDYLEMHFAEPLTPSQHALLNSLAQTLSEAWRNRTEGLFIANVLGKEETDAQPASEPDVLSHRNPARLSRAEYRVCLLLSRGLQLDAVCSELAIAKSTLRTHLRNIYAKTATENLPELLYALLRNPKQSVDFPNRRIA